MVSIRLENLTKKFGETVAADDISLDIKDKEFFILVGPSGGGKSTILNVMAGLEPATSGHVYFDGTCVDDVPPEKRDVAMVFQSYALYPYMNVYDNISFGLKMHKVPKTDIDKRVKEAADMLKIGDYLKRKPYELSGGERQRVALARAIVRHPKAFLMDEPMSNLDAKLRVGMRAELIRLQKQLEITTVYVTHDQVEAMTMADRIGVLHKGRLKQCGSPMEIYKHPDNLFVAEFIGSPPMNLFDCSRTEQIGGCLETSGFRLKLPKDLVKEIMNKTDATEFILGIRPQDISIHRKPQKPESIETEIYAIEPLGSETLVDLKLGENIIKVLAREEYAGRIGDKAWINIDTDKIYLFDKKTEENIL